MTQKAFVRLPVDVIPVNYNIKIVPDFEKFSFQGSESIELKIESPTDTITFNAKEITLETVLLTSENGEKIKPISVDCFPEEEKVSIKLPQKLSVGKSVLQIDFSGIINDTMNGFYRTKYVGCDGVTRHLAVTQFEATSARKAFPCWDEPAHKASFDITLVVPKDMIALSNMPMVKEDVCGGQKTCVFQRSAIMSTYLVAYAVGHFECVEGFTPNGVKVAVYTPLGRKHEGEFALKVAVKTLPFYDDFFAIPYPLPKCDLIAIPEFNAGAMENWGLVTFRETALLIDSKISSPSGYQRVALVVGHELAHQWFGNLVTMEWWTDLWLNEGFATWVEYLCVDYCFPEYDIWTQFLSDDYSRAQTLDALKNTHPIEITVGNPDEIDEIFDAISYSKGACVIRMLNSYMGADKFKEGLRHYLNKYKYGNARTKDLWDALEHTSGMPVASMMSTWTKQSGFPVITASIKNQTPHETLLHLEQTRFCADGSSEHQQTVWTVPITVVTSESPVSPVATALMTGKTLDIAIKSDGRSIPSYIKLNLGQSGFYRVCYSEEMLKPLISLLSSASDCPFTAVERYGIQNDLFWLSRIGKVSPTHFLDLFKRATHETDFTVWSDRLSNLGAIKTILAYSASSSKSLEKLNKLICDCLKPIFTKISQPAGHLDQMLHSMMFGFLGRSGDVSVISLARSYFEAHVKNNEPIPKHLRGAVFNVVMYHADVETVNQAQALYEKATQPEEKVQLLRSLGVSPCSDISHKVLQYTVSDKVLNQDRVFPISGVSSTHQGRKVAWEFFKQNFDSFKAFYPSGGFLLSSTVSCITGQFAISSMAEEVEKFFANNPIPSADRVIKQSVEQIRLNSDWLTKAEGPIVSWLDANSK